MIAIHEPSFNHLGGDGKTPIHECGGMRTWFKSTVFHVAAVTVYEFDEGRFTVLKQTPHWTVKNKGKWNEKRTFSARSNYARYTRLGAAMEYARQWIAEKAAAMGDEYYQEKAA